MSASGRCGKTRLTILAAMLTNCPGPGNRTGRPFRRGRFRGWLAGLPVYTRVMFLGSRPPCALGGAADRIRHPGKSR
jgi:hypothetical protein